ncbi:MAG: EamA family transporter [Bacteroidota bacterium]
MAAANKARIACLEMLMILSVLCWSVYTVISKSLTKYDPVVITAFSTITGTIFLVPVVIIEQWGRPLPVISANAWAAIFILGFSLPLFVVFFTTRYLKILPAASVGNFI